VGLVLLMTAARKWKGKKLISIKLNKTNVYIAYIKIEEQLIYTIVDEESVQKLLTVCSQS
jgi:hypothetical protein